MILISACLLGRHVKYNGGHNLTSWLAAAYDPQFFLPVCPEVLAGFSIPRPPVELQGGDGKQLLALYESRERQDLGSYGPEDGPSVHNKQGLDITREFLREIPLLTELVRRHKITAAILKERSPSCGVAQIYDGSFSGVRISGQGVATAALSKAGVTCYSEETLTKEILQQLLAREQEK
jgi:uncharacterized protein YbbK (DUF523 family)